MQPGFFLGLAENVGDGFTYEILPGTSGKIYIFMKKKHYLNMNLVIVSVTDFGIFNETYYSCMKLLLLPLLFYMSKILTI